ncbi:FBD-associated F-box protein At2g26860-like [Rutidosis leptorrhynchoides]|uniref:FBD-associated F-box protein At2g26860-like n=1 Tax=Rutidosis leptorrhynchoides TaxID=125765 RepID=UPI003A9A3CFA
MENSKRTKPSKGNNGVDRISNLPDPILHLILSRLPETEEVVRTSILSTGWRYLWTSMTSLDIDCRRGFDPSNFNEFVYWVLLNQTLDLDTFRLSCINNNYNKSTVWRWIHAAVMRKVKFLDLTFCPISRSEDVELPHCMVMCESLVALRLYLFNHKLHFKGFLALKVLELNSVDLSDGDLIGKFLESCPVLEDLSLYDCMIYDLEDFTITCPNLKTLRFAYGKTYGDNDLFSFSMGLRFIAQNLCIWSMQCVGAARHPNIYFPTSLPNLKTLEITTSLDVVTMNAVVMILKASPVLKHFSLIILNTHEDDNGSESWELEEVLAHHLKRVEFVEFNGETPICWAARVSWTVKMATRSIGPTTPF